MSVETKKEAKESLCMSCDNYCYRKHNPKKNFDAETFEKCLAFGDWISFSDVIECNRYLKRKDGL